MTTVAYALGRPRPAAARGGDCRAYDLDQARNVDGHHRFAATTHCRIDNGFVRLTVGASGAEPSLTVEAQRRKITIGDVYEDTYSDLYDGSLDPGTWVGAGTITIGSSLLSPLLTAVQIARITPEAVTLRLVVPVMADAYVTLRRGERMVRIQHGNTRGPQVTTSRRVRWTGSPAPAGTIYTKRIEETSPTLDGLHRFVATLDTATVNDGTFSLMVLNTASARFGAGVGTTGANDGPADMHKQLRDASRPKLVAVAA